MTTPIFCHFQILLEPLSIHCYFQHAYRSYITPGGISMMQNIFKILSSCEDYNHDQHTGDLLDALIVKKSKVRFFRLLWFSLRHFASTIFACQGSRELKMGSSRGHWALKPRFSSTIAMSAVFRCWIIEKRPSTPAHKSPWMVWWDKGEKDHSVSEDLLDLSTLDEIIGESGKLVVVLPACLPRDT